MDTCTSLRKTRQCQFSSQHHLASLQCLHDALARVELWPTRRTVLDWSSKSTLYNLHWLPVEWRIKYKFAFWLSKQTLVWRLHSCRLHCSATFFHAAVFAPTIPTSFSFLLKTHLQCQRLPRCGPTTSNSIPPDTWSITPLPSFRRHLKNLISSSANSWTQGFISAPSARKKNTWRYSVKSFDCTDES